MANMVAVVRSFISVERSGSLHKAKCPFHNDTEPSFTVYESSAYCFGCNRYFNPASFVMEMKDITYRKAKQWLRKKHFDLVAYEREEKDTSPSTPIPSMVINYWYRLATGDSEVVRYYKKERLLTRDTIDKYQLGWDGQNYVIPIWESEPGNSPVFGVKFRNSGGEGPKYWNLPGRGQPKLFGKHQLNGAGKAYIFFGEFDALLAIQDGFSAVSPTSGCNTWRREWNYYFKDIEKIYVCPDFSESSAGYSVASNFLGRARVCPFPQNLKDYNDYRKDRSVQDFEEEVLNGN